MASQVILTTNYMDNFDFSDFESNSKSSQLSSPIFSPESSSTLSDQSSLMDLSDSYDYQFQLDFLDSTPFMGTPNPFLSEALAPLASDNLPPVRVEFNDQPEDILPHNLSPPQLFSDSIGLVDPINIDDEDENDENKNEHMTAEELFLQINCSQRSQDEEAERSQTQRSQSSQLGRSQDNSNILQVRSLDNSILSSPEFSQPLVIASLSSHASSSGTGTGTQPSTSQAILLSQPSSSQSYSNQSVTCCRKHQRYHERIGRKLQERRNTFKSGTINENDLYLPSVKGFLKPPFSHNLLCAFAIKSDPTNKKEVSAIYKFLIDCFPYFQNADMHWRNSLRHSLATCNWFIKTGPPRTAKKGNKHTLNPEKKQCLDYEIRKQCVTDVTKLNHCLSAPYVCEYLLNMRLLDLDDEQLSELYQANDQFDPNWIRLRH